jgi:hypothetical protein
MLTLALDPAGLAYPLALDSSLTTTGSMSRARTYHTATLLSSGKVLVAGGNSGGGYQTSAELYDIAVGAVNDAPTLDPIADITIDEDSGAQTITLGGIGSGAADESRQNLSITAISSNPVLVPDPSVDYTSPNAAGTLSFAPVAGTSGTVTITVTVRDNGGVANGGVDFVERVVTVSVAPVNDAPSFVAGANQR